jgi:RNA polymerase sigma-70 factor (family 1)
MARRLPDGRDQYLIRELQKGNESGFTGIFNQYYSQMLLYACRFTENQAIAEDIVEEAFISLWNKRDIISEIHSLKSYLYTVTRNGCLSWIRKKKREIATNKTASTLEEHFERTALENLIYSETMTKIYAAIDRLPTQCKKVFILHYLEGKKISEIAEELNISVGTVKTHKVRGIDLLQNLLLSVFFLISITS